jgi:ADP-ribosylglycohydrolase
MKEDKIKGLIFGQAIGDALGLSTEFLSKNQVNDVYKGRITYDNIYQDDYRKTWKKGEWTDDTDMFLILFKHLLNSEKYLVDELLLAKDFHDWYNKGFEIQDNIYKSAKGVGINIGRVLKDKTFLSNPKLSSFKISLHSKSNGSLMRSGILSIFPNTIFNTIESCKITHFSDDCIVSCLFLVLFLKRLQVVNSVIEDNIEDNIENILYQIESLNYDVDNLRQIINIKNISELDLNNNIGYTYKPIGCAIYALRNLKNKSFYDALEEIIREGGDGDTNGCVTGCVLGCYMGFDNIDKWLIENLEHKSYLLEKYFIYINKIMKYPDPDEDEIKRHFDYIVKNRLQDTVYDYTISSMALRKENNKMKNLNDLILNAPMLDKQYTVYNMKSSHDKILYINTNKRQTRFIETSDLKIGDIFSQQSNYDYNVISTTYDKNYPLSKFSYDLSIDMDNMDNIDLLTFKDVAKFTKFNKDIKIVYSKLNKYINKYIKNYEQEGEDITIEDITIEEIYNEIYNEDDAENKILITKLKKIIMERYYLDLCCCCLFRIKLTNKTGLLIEKCSHYPDQKEILIPDPTFFIVKNKSRELYKIIDPFEHYEIGEPFIINNISYKKNNKLQLHEISAKKTKMVTVYDIEVIDISKHINEEKSWFNSYKNISMHRSDPVLYRVKSLESLYEYISSKKSSTRMKSSKKKSSTRMKRRNSL